MGLKSRYGVAFLNTSNKQFEKEIRKKIIFPIASKGTKYLGISICRRQKTYTLKTANHCQKKLKKTFQEATVRTRHRTMDCFKIGKGVCQSHILSLCLFNLYAEYIMENARLD